MVAVGVPACGMKPTVSVRLFKCAGQVNVTDRVSGMFFEVCHTHEERQVHFLRKSARNVFLSNTQQFAFIRPKSCGLLFAAPPEHLLWQAIEFHCIETEAIKGSGGKDVDKSAC